MSSTLLSTRLGEKSTVHCFSVQAPRNWPLPVSGAMKSSSRGLSTLPALVLWSCHVPSNSPDCSIDSGTARSPSAMTTGTDLESLWNRNVIRSFTVAIRRGVSLDLFASQPTNTVTSIAIAVAQRIKINDASHRSGGRSLFGWRSRIGSPGRARCNASDRQSEDAALGARRDNTVRARRLYLDQQEPFLEPYSAVGPQDWSSLLVCLRGSLDRGIGHHIQVSQHIRRDSYPDSA